MRRLMTKYWKVLAYFVGLVALAIVGLDTLGQIYTGVGMAWLVVFILRNNDGSGTPVFRIDGDMMDSRNMHGSYYRND